MIGFLEMIDVYSHRFLEVNEFSHKMHQQPDEEIQKNRRESVAEYA